MIEIADDVRERPPARNDQYTMISRGSHDGKHALEQVWPREQAAADFHDNVCDGQQLRSPG